MLVYLKTYCPEGDKQERNENQTQEMTGVMGVKSQRLSVRQIWLFCLLRWMCSSPLFVMMSCCQSEQVISGCSAVYHFVARRTAVVMKRPTSETQVTGWSAELQQEDSQCGWAEDQCDALLCSKRHTHMNTFLLAEVLLWNPEHCIYFALSRNGMCRKSVQQQGRKQNKKLRSSSTKNFKFHLTWTTFGHIQNNHYQRILLQGRKSSVSFHKACLKASEVMFWSYALNLWRAASFKKKMCSRWWETARRAYLGWSAEQLRAEQWRWKQVLQWGAYEAQTARKLGWQQLPRLQGGKRKSAHTQRWVSKDTQQMSHTHVKSEHTGKIRNRLVSPTTQADSCKVHSGTKQEELGLKKQTHMYVRFPQHRTKHDVNDERTAQFETADPMKADRFWLKRRWCSVTGQQLCEHKLLLWSKHLRKRLSHSHFSNLKLSLYCDSNNDNLLLLLLVC